MNVFPRFVAAGALLLCAQCNHTRADCVSMDVLCNPLTAFLVQVPDGALLTSNFRDGGDAVSGFFTGTVASSTGVFGVEVSADGGSFETATLVGNAFSYRLPLTWREGSQHTLTVRVRSIFPSPSSDLTTLSITKQHNRDLNGDGYRDLVLAGRRTGVPGRVYVYHGGARIDSGLSTAAPDTVIDGAATGDQFANDVVSGDVNGDGYSDLIVGAMDVETPFANSGAVYVFYGRAGGIATTASTEADVTMSGPLNAQLGDAVAAGDLNGDGYDDIAAGATLENGSAGTVRIYYGSAAGPSATATTVLSAENANDEAGSFLQIADVDGDGFAELAVSSIGWAAGGVDGRVYIFSGSASGIAGGAATASLGTADATFSGVGGGELGVDPQFADFNNDGRGDILIAANADLTYLFLSTAAGFTSSVQTSADAMFTPAVASDSSSAGAGDLNNDGIPEMITTFPGLGLVSIIPGGSSIPASVGGADLLYQFTGTASTFGIDLQTGDWDGNGYNDLAVSDTGFGIPGRVFIYYGSEGGLDTSPGTQLDGAEAQESLGIRLD